MDDPHAQAANGFAKGGHVLPLSFQKEMSFNELYETDLKKQGLYVLPHTIFLKFTPGLRIIRASFNYLTSLPARLAEFTLLNELDLSYNRFRSIPRVVTELPHLRVLVMTGNDISFLNSSILNLTSLQLLNLGLNEFRAFPQTALQLKSLTTLHLNHNHIASFECAAAACTQLKSLNIASNLLERLPDELDRLASLTVLDVSRNRLAFLPESIGSLKRLTKLNLSHNSLAALPCSLAQVQTLNALDLSSNKLKCLPKEWFFATASGTDIKEDASCAEQDKTAGLLCTSGTTGASLTLVAPPVAAPSASFTFPSVIAIDSQTERCISHRLRHNVSNNAMDKLINKQTHMEQMRKQVLQRKEEKKKDQETKAKPKKRFEKRRDIARESGERFKSIENGEEVRPSDLSVAAEQHRADTDAVGGGDDDEEHDSHAPSTLDAAEDGADGCVPACAAAAASPPITVPACKPEDTDYTTLCSGHDGTSSPPVLSFMGAEAALADGLQDATAAIEIPSASKGLADEHGPRSLPSRHVLDGIAAAEDAPCAAKDAQDSPMLLNAGALKPEIPKSLTPKSMVEISTKSAEGRSDGGEPGKEPRRLKPPRQKLSVVDKKAKKEFSSKVFPALKELYLQKNALEMLPKTFFDTFSTLKVLDLSSNYLSELPVASPSTKKQLRTLYVQSNNLTALPACVSKLEGLTDFDASFNYLRKVQAPPNLKSIALAYNPLLQPPIGLQDSKVEEIVLSGCSLGIPLLLTEPVHLRVAQLSYNRFGKVPEFLAKCPELKTLDLAFNTIQEFPPFVEELQQRGCDCNLVQAQPKTKPSTTMTPQISSQTILQTISQTTPQMSSQTVSQMILQPTIPPAKINLNNDVNTEMKIEMGATRIIEPSTTVSTQSSHSPSAFEASATDLGELDSVDEQPGSTPRARAQDTVVLKKLLIGKAEMKGKREHMEDRSVFFTVKPLGRMLCIFDGHGGSEASEIAAQRAEQVFVQELAGKTDAEKIKRALRRGLKVLNRLIFDNLPSAKRCGTTSLVVLITSAHIFTANLGDTRAVLCSIDGETLTSKRLSTDHRPLEQSEYDRIRSLDGFVTEGGRVNDILGVSRALGDFFIVLPRKRSASAPVTVEPSAVATGRSLPPALEREDFSTREFFELARAHAPTPPVCCTNELATPALELSSLLSKRESVPNALFDDGRLCRLVSDEAAVSVHTRTPTDAFIVMGCDGLWDVTTDAEATEIVSRGLFKLIETPEQAAHRLLTYAYTNGSTDNISVVVYLLPFGRETLKSAKAIHKEYVKGKKQQKSTNGSANGAFSLNDSNSTSDSCFSANGSSDN